MKTKIKLTRAKVQPVCFILGCLVFAFGCTDLFSLRGYAVAAGTLLLAVSMVMKGLKRPSVSFIVVCVISLFTTIAFIVYKGFSLSGLFFYCALPVIFFLLGAQCRENKNELLFLVLSITIGFLIKGLLLVDSTILNSGFLFYNFLTFFWGPKTDGLAYVARNSLTLYFLPVITATISVILYKNRFRKWYDLLLLFALDAFAVWASLSAGNRAFLVVLALLIYFALLAAIEKTKNQLFQTVFFVLPILLFTIYFLFFFGVLSLPSWMESIPIINRLLGNGSNSERLSLYAYFFQNAWRYPFGGLYSNWGRYVHSYVLDIYNEYGLIPFLGESVLLIFSFLNAFMKRKRLNFSAKLLVWLMIGFVLLGLFEPIVDTDNVINAFIFLFFGFFDYFAKTPDECLSRQVSKTVVTI